MNVDQISAKKAIIFALDPNLMLVPRCRRDPLEDLYGLHFRLLVVYCDGFSSRTEKTGQGRALNFLLPSKNKINKKTKDCNVDDDFKKP